MNPEKLGFDPTNRRRTSEKVGIAQMMLMTGFENNDPPLF
jgi:hypothetical protein